MIHIIATHEVDDVEHWFTSPLRKELFEPRGIKATAFRDPEGNSTLTAVLIEAPDMETFQRILAEPKSQEAAASDGVRLDTLKVFVAN
ncbi:MAG: hypothetical protein GXP35_01580 [Actinobacteria bacterium]|nr:hypothetical protein [Actinomycetota bacterium]